MKIYTVYTKENDPNQLENIILIKEGFSWIAFILHFFWAFYNKMWLVGIILIAINSFLSILEIKNYISPEIIQPIRVGFLFFIGCNFNDWYSYSLIKKGYSFYGVVSGTNEDEASYHFVAEMLQRTTFVSGQGLPRLV